MQDAFYVVYIFTLRSGISGNHINDFDKHEKIKEGEEHPAKRQKRNHQKYLCHHYQPAFILQIQTINVLALIENPLYNR